MMKLKYILLHFPIFLWAQVKILTVVPAFSLIAHDIGGEKIVTEALFDRPFDIHHVSLKPSQKLKLHSADIIFTTAEFASLLTDYKERLVVLKSKSQEDNSCSCCGHHDHNQHKHHDHDDHKHHDHDDHKHHEHNEHKHHHHHGLIAHEWLSFQYVKDLAVALANKLSEVDSQNKELYERNLVSFTQRVNRIYDVYKDYPDVSRKVFLHDSFFHLEEELGLDFGITLKKCHDTNIIPSVLHEVLSHPGRYTTLVVQYPVDKGLTQKVLDKTQLELLEVDSLGYFAPENSSYGDYIENLLITLAN